jgi:hypothetical protein
MNAYAHWLAPFLRSGYNLVDTAVVFLSLLALGPLNVPVSILRVVRAFRVVRIFGRLRSLKNIISGIAASIAPVSNAFLIMLLVVSICEWGSGPLLCSHQDLATEGRRGDERQSATRARSLAGGEGGGGKRVFDL